MAGAPGWNEVVWPEADEVDLAAASAALPAAGSYIVRFVWMVQTYRRGTGRGMNGLIYYQRQPIGKVARFSL